MEFIEVAEYKIGKRGARGFILSLPKTWMKRVGAKTGDVIQCWCSPRSDDLILRLKK